MIKSMTGYGHCENIVDSMNICAELKSVNHRYFEFSSEYPEATVFLRISSKN